MISKEFIRSVVRSNHVIAVHMKGEERLDGLSHTIYVIYDLVLNEEEEKQLLWNTIHKVYTEGRLRIKAVRSSQVDISIQDSQPQEYTIDTRDIVKYETT